MEEQLIVVLAGLGYSASWGNLGQGTALPRIVLHQVGGADSVTLEGRAGWLSGLVQIDCYGATYAQATGVARAVRAALTGYRGGPIWHAQVRGIRSRPDEAGGDVIQRVSLDVAVLYQEPAA